MPSNTRYAVAIHTAGMLAFSGCMPVNSEIIAQSVDTNPVVVRRIISMLARHGLVKVRKGHGGGATLTRPPEQITLAEIYKAVESKPVFNSPAGGSKKACPVARHLMPVLGVVFESAERAMLDSLSRVTLAEIIRCVGSRMKAEGCRRK